MHKGLPSYSSYLVRFRSHFTLSVTTKDKWQMKLKISIQKEKDNNPRVSLLFVSYETRYNDVR